ncbi:TetR/AcrR family transcriptional regulator [Rhizobium sp. FY34]|uniref:TetR/AcrR family transcriptional regulator n=1 Tax=Rhizobium sp. FY34 TaxID=2562309 RepID=UPI0010C07770|nr:TetR/AcrR family transcriptional regulator [Rhizobium sp. FY34]
MSGNGSEDLTRGSAHPRHRRSLKGEERRQAILTAAMARFAADGYQNASFAAIAEDVGLSLPGLLHYFPTKVHLLLAILARRDLESAKALDNLRLPWRPLLVGLVEQVRRNTESAGVVRAFAILNAESLTRDHPAEVWFRDRSAVLMAIFGDVVADGIAAGEIRPEVRPDDIAAELIALMDGLQMLWLRDRQRVDIVSIFSGAIDRLVAAIEIR